MVLPVVGDGVGLTIPHHVGFLQRLLNAFAWLPGVLDGRTDALGVQDLLIPALANHRDRRRIRVGSLTAAV